MASLVGVMGCGGRSTLDESTAGVEVGGTTSLSSGGASTTAGGSGGSGGSAWNTGGATSTAGGGGVEAIPTPVGSGGAEPTPVGSGGTSTAPEPSPPGSAGASAQASCGSAADCANGELCCASYDDGNLSSTCAASCEATSSPSVQICETSAECADGERCRTAFGSLRVCSRRGRPGDRGD